MRLENTKLTWRTGALALVAFSLVVGAAHSVAWGKGVAVAAPVFSTTILDPFSVSVSPADTTNTTLVPADSTDPFSGAPPTKSAYIPPGRAPF